MAATTTNAYLNAAKAVFHVSIGTFTAHVNGYVAELKLTKSGEFKREYAPFKIKEKKIALSVESTAGTQVDLIKTRITKVETAINNLETELEDKKLQISKLENALSSVSLLIEKGDTASENFGVGLSEMSFREEKNKISNIKKETELKNIKISISSGDSSIQSADLMIHP